MWRKARAQLKLIVEGKRPETIEIIRQIDQYQIQLIDPKNFDENDVDNYIKKLELSFESLCTSLEELGVHKPGELTVFQFFTRLTYFEKKKTKQAQGRRR